MEELLQYFPFVLYLLGTILLIILIVLAVKLIKTVDKTNAILEDAYNKTRSLNGLFHAIDSITDTLSSVSDSIVGNITAIIGKVFHRKNKKVKENEEDE